MRLGIDFGTTRTVVAASDRGNAPAVSFEGPDGTLHAHIPTLAATDGASWRYGWDAVEVMSDAGWSVARSFKRALGGHGASLHGSVRVGPHQVSILDLVGGFVAHLRDQLAESTAPNAHTIHDELEVMVAVPAGASSAQRMITLAAFRQAGFTVKGLMNEPSAAGVEYAHRYKRTLTSARQDILVYDLGGGTFDASRVCMEGGVHRVVGHAGLSELGGTDVDAALLSLALQEAGLPPTDRADWLEAARESKEGIHPNTRKVLVELGEHEATVAVSALYEAVGPLVERTLEVLEPLASEDGLAGVYVVGGGSELPLVARRLKERFGRRVKRSSYASASVAVGLALAMGGEAPELHEVLGRGFGVFREARSGTDVAFDALLPPGHRSADEVVRRYRAVHNVGYLRFVECDLLTDDAPDGVVTPFAEVRVPYDATLVGEDLHDVSVRPLQDGPAIEERYQLDADGRVVVTIRNLSNGTVLIDNAALSAAG